MTTTTPPSDRPELVSGRQGCLISGFSHYKLMKLAALGQIRTEALPGNPVRFYRADLEKLALPRPPA